MKVVVYYVEMTVSKNSNQNNLSRVSFLQNIKYEAQHNIPGIKYFKMFVKFMYGNNVDDETVFSVYI